MRMLRFVMLLSIGACAGAPEATPDDFVLAARSWEGFDALQMIYVWGPPDKLEADRATWRLGHRSTRCLDAARRVTVYGDRVAHTQRECVPIGTKHKCRVTAIFDPTGQIVEVTAFSFRCARIYSDYIRALDSDYPYNRYNRYKPKS